MAVCSSPSGTMNLQRLCCDIPLDYCSSLSDVRVWHISFQGPFHDRSPAAGASISTESAKKSLKKRKVVFLAQVISVVWSARRFHKLSRIIDYSAKMETGRLQECKKSLRHLYWQSYYIVQLHLEYLIIFVIYTEVWKFLSSIADGKLGPREIKWVVCGHIRNTTTVV